MSENLFSEIQSYLREHTAMSDRWLQEFAAGWGKTGNSQEGVNDADVPKWWENEYLRLQAKARKESVAVSVVGRTITRDENGNVSIQGSTVFSAADWITFLRVAMSMPSGTEMPSTQGFGGTSSSNIIPQVKDDRPQIVANQKRNEENMALAVRNQIKAQTQLGIDQQRARKERLRQEMEY